MQNLLDLNREGLEKFFSDIGEKPFRARQLLQWMHKRGVTDFARMTDISRPLREKLADIAVVDAPKVVLDKPSRDGTHKWVVQMADKNCIETVFIPDGNRGTLCVSSQVGCMLNCSFCSTGKQGFNRNLSVSEIIGQVWAAVRGLSAQAGKHDRHITNVVMMGMGEPLMNFDSVVKAMDIMLDDYAYGLSRRRVTLSTSGVVPKMYELLEKSRVSLAVSLHAPNDELRNELVPLNRKYNIEQLLEACRAYAASGPHKQITFEYTLMSGVNDTEAHAHELGKLLKTVPSKINLIPFNPFPGIKYIKPSNNQIHRFRETLAGYGYTVTVRKTRGDDIDAACGQLVGEVQDKTRRQERYMRSLEAF